MLSFAYPVPQAQSTLVKRHPQDIGRAPSSLPGNHRELNVGFAPSLGFFAACANALALRSDRLRRARLKGRRPTGLGGRASVTVFAGKPLVLDKQRSLTTASMIVMGAAFYASKILANPVARQALVAFAAHPLSACTLIFGIGTFFAFVAWGLGWQGSPGCPLYYDRNEVKLLLSANAMHVLTFVFALWTAKHLNLAVSPVAQSTLAFLLLFNMVPYFSIPGSLALIFCGITAVSFNPVPIEQIGKIFAVLSIISWGLKAVLSRAFLKSGKIDGTNLLSLFSLNALLLSLPAKLFWEGISFFPGTVVLR